MFEIAGNADFFFLIHFLPKVKLEQVVAECLEGEPEEVMSSFFWCLCAGEFFCSLKLIKNTFWFFFFLFFGLMF